jgi:hypothetical protein
MRARGLAILAIVLAIAACSDVSSPTDVATVPAAGPEAHFLGGQSFNDRGKLGGHDDHSWGGKRGHDRDHDECDDSDRQGDAFHHGVKRGRYAHHWSLRRYDFHRHGKKHGHHDGDRDDSDCGGETGPGTIQGLVQNDGAAASGYPVYLLSADGATVVATTTTDGTGAFTFAAVPPGTYLVCEADPFVAAYGFLAESTPSTGSACPAGYAPLGYSITVNAGGTSAGNTFLNFGLV